MKIWAHRGCSQMYPENTLLSFGKAIAIEGLAGIETDVQLTKDGEMVIIHDESVDRTTDGTGFVRDHTYSELMRLSIDAGSARAQKIPTLKEVLDLLDDRLRNGMKLNIELKNSVFPYPGMEEKVVEEIAKRGLEEAIVYSSFYAESISKIKSFGIKSELAILDTKVSDCLWKLKGGCGATALHPYWRGIDIPKERLEGYTVRAWFSGHLYPEKPTGGRLDMGALEAMGITDVFLNEPEVYL